MLVCDIPVTPSHDLAGELTMKLLHFALMLAPFPALAASPFDGTWKTQTSTYEFSKKPYTFTVDESEFTCASCAPAYTVKPDGTDQKVTGHGYDTAAAVIKDAKTVEVTQKLAGKLLDTQTFMVSADGKQIMYKDVDHSGAAPTTVSVTLKRTSGEPAAGKHAVTGSWVPTTVDISGPGALATYRVDDEGAHMESNGTHYDAKFDGKPAPLAGDPTHLHVSVKRLSPSSFEETYTRAGKVVDRTRYEVAEDGKSIKVTDTDRTGRVTHYLLQKQG
jgi:hypothetical protein